MIKIEIQNWWNSKTWTNKYVKLDLDKTLKACGKITICTVLIDGEVVGCVEWDGKDLTISKELVRPSFKGTEALMSSLEKNIGSVDITSARISKAMVEIDKRFKDEFSELIDRALLKLVLKRATVKGYSRRGLSKFVKKNFGIRAYCRLQGLWKNRYLYYNSVGVINPTRKAYVDFYPI